MDTNRQEEISSWAFPPEFNPGIYPTRLVTGVENIRQSLEILFSTLPGERVHRADYGFSFKEIVFEPTNLGTRTLIEDHLRRAVEVFEPRIRIDQLAIDDTDIVEGIWKIYMEYTILQYNTTDQITYSVQF